MRKGFKVIDADAHLQDDLSRWVDYVEPEYWDRRPRLEIIDDKDGFSSIGSRRYATVLPCELVPAGGDRTSTIQGAGGSRGARGHVHDFMANKYGDSYHQEWSAQSRLKDMDEYGWDRQVMIPGVGSLGWSRTEGRDQGLLWALARAYNNWAHDFASANPARLRVVGDLPNQHDVEGLVTEARRCVEELNAVTVMMPKGSKERPWESPEYNPFYGLAEALDFPIAFHGVMSGDPHTGTRYKPRSRVPGQQVALDHALGFPFEDMLSMGHLIYMGILERFAKLRVVFMEGNAGWLAWWISRLDDHALESRRQGMWFDAPLLKMAPSEYFRRQGYVACDGDEGSLPGVIHLGWEDNTVWNTDYPHPDAPDPDKAVDSLLDQAISDEAKRKILWDNAACLFGDRILS
jgi:predicted TIM-barrel fold metal-dependent hydrolase